MTAAPPELDAANAAEPAPDAEVLGRPHPATVRPDEQARFNALAVTWWDPKGPMRPLHAVNRLRVGTVVAQAERYFGRVPGSGLAGLRVLDVGCGAGLMSEALASRGAEVTGVDAAARSIAIARQHAAGSGLPVTYRVGDPAQALQADEQFDLVLVLEVVEHVQDLPAFMADALAHLRPGGLVVASTINRTWRSFAFAIVGAEWLLRLLPRGTHRWRQFVRPAELAALMARAGLAERTLLGMRYEPWFNRASWCDSTAVNYLAVFGVTTFAAVPDRGVGSPRFPAQERPA